MIDNLVQGGGIARERVRGRGGAAMLLFQYVLPTGDVREMRVQGARAGPQSGWRHQLQAQRPSQHLSVAGRIDEKIRAHDNRAVVPNAVAPPTARLMPQ